MSVITFIRLILSILLLLSFTRLLLFILPIKAVFGMSHCTVQEYGATYPGHISTCLTRALLNISTLGIAVVFLISGRMPGLRGLAIWPVMFLVLAGRSRRKAGTMPFEAAITLMIYSFNVYRLGAYLSHFAAQEYGAPYSGHISTWFSKWSYMGNGHSELHLCS